jgi:predicted  nucleic acid-binding Zn-ribbon protein
MLAATGDVQWRKHEIGDKSQVDVSLADPIMLIMFINLFKRRRNNHHRLHLIHQQPHQVVSMVPLNLNTDGIELFVLPCHQRTNFLKGDYSHIKIDLALDRFNPILRKRGLAPLPDTPPRNLDRGYCCQVVKDFLANGPLLRIRQDSVDLLDFDEVCCLHCLGQHQAGEDCKPIHWFLSLIWQVVRHGRVRDVGTDARIFEWPGEGLVSAAETVKEIRALKEELAAAKGTEKNARQELQDLIGLANGRQRENVELGEEVNRLKAETAFAHQRVSTITVCRYEILVLDLTIFQSAAEETVVDLCFVILDLCRRMSQGKIHINRILQQRDHAIRSSTDVQISLQQLETTTDLIIDDLNLELAQSKKDLRANQDAIARLVDELNTAQGAQQDELQTQTRAWPSVRELLVQLRNHVNRSTADANRLAELGRQARIDLDAMEQSRDKERSQVDIERRHLAAAVSQLQQLESSTTATIGGLRDDLDTMTLDRDQIQSDFAAYRTQAGMTIATMQVQRNRGEQERQNLQTNLDESLALVLSLQSRQRELLSEHADLTLELGNRKDWFNHTKMTLKPVARRWRMRERLTESL